MDAPIRDYMQYGEVDGGTCEQVEIKTTRRKREKPFAAEYALLAELGLRRD